MHPKVLCPVLGSLEGDVDILDQGLEHLPQESEQELGLLSLEERLRELELVILEKTWEDLVNVYLSGGEK